jgi:RNA polymerase sigma-70 factor (ECF subfamily)
MSDGELVRLARAGRAEAYAELVSRWAGRVTAFCHARVGNAHLAEDLAQETLLRGLRCLDSLSDPERFGSWLCGIALRICLDWRKAKKNNQVPFSVLRADQDPEGVLVRCNGDLAELERREEVSRLLAEVEALPDEYRQVVMLYYYQDVTYRDLAQLLGVSPGTINARLTRARALLRARLSPCSR